MPTLGGHELGHREDGADVRNSLGARPAVASYKPATPTWPTARIRSLISGVTDHAQNALRPDKRHAVAYQGRLERGAVTAATIALGNIERDVLDAFSTKPSRSILTLRIGVSYPSHVAS
jgi:hypothetical protein